MKEDTEVLNLVDRVGDYVVVRSPLHPGMEYEIPVKMLIKDFCEWLLHLADKNWFTMDHARRLAEIVLAATGGEEG